MPRGDDHSKEPPDIDLRAIFQSMRTWWGKRSERAARNRDAAKWVKGLGADYVVELMKSVPLPEEFFTEIHYYTAEERLEGQRLYLVAVCELHPNETSERQNELAAWMLYWRLRQWAHETNHERLGALIAQDAARREAYRADYAARLSAAAAADPTTAENRRAYAQQAFLNTGKYLTNTGRELTPSERKQLGLPSNK